MLLFQALFALYRALLWLLTPWIALGLAVNPRWSLRARERWGFGVPLVEPGAVWIHAASLGEGRVAQALIPAIRSAIPRVEILRTCTSLTAREQAVGADQTLLAPLDVPLAVNAFLDRTRPRCLILAEAELWPVLLDACRAREIPIAVVNARLGPALRRWRRVPGLWEALTREISWTAPDAATAAELGGLAVGDLKAEAVLGRPGLVFQRPTVIGGSTHRSDEAALIAGCAELVPRPLLVLAPRDPRRFDEVWARLQASPGVSLRRTRVGPVVPPDVDMLLLDTVGELGSLYNAAQVAFVGGTYEPAVGGHSPAEATAAGCPVVHGPCVSANPGAWEGVAGFVARTPAALASAIAAALDVPRTIPVQTRAAEATVRALEVSLDAGPAPEHALRPWLWPLVPVWATGVVLRRLCGRPKRVPGGKVVSVGSLAAGGAGKTPVAAWVAEVVGGTVVSRGYGRDAGVDLRTAGEATWLGDELTMLARRGVPVVSAPDRSRGVAAVFAGARAGRVGVAVLDDGLQVASIHRDLDIVVVDARFPGGDGMIPVGTRRLPLSALLQADVVWLNHAGAETPVPPLLRPHVRPGAVVVRARYRPLDWLVSGRAMPLAELPARPVAAFAGIARPEGFFRLLRDLGLVLDHTWAFPDHHRYTPSDLVDIEAYRATHVIVTTEKDAARLPPDAAVWALRLQIEILSGEPELRARLAAVVGGS